MQNLESLVCVSKGSDDYDHPEGKGDAKPWRSLVCVSKGKGKVEHWSPSLVLLRREKERAEGRSIPMVRAEH